MKLPNTAHTSRPWRIHEVAPDFQVEDVWALQTPGGPDELPRLVSSMVSDNSDNFPQGAPLVVRFLWEARWKIGALFGWDGKDAGLGSRVTSLRDRLPKDLREAPSGPDFKDVPFTSLYLLEDEWAAEMANRTVHTVMHIGWVPDESGGYRGQMAVLVKPNGLLGAAVSRGAPSVGRATDASVGWAAWGSNPEPTVPRSPWLVVCGWCRNVPVTW